MPVPHATQAQTHDPQAVQVGVQMADVLGEHFQRAVGTAWIGWDVFANLGLTGVEVTAHRV